MTGRLDDRGRAALRTAVLAAVLFWSSVAFAFEYKPITPTMESTTITLNGHDLTIQQVIDVARHGASSTAGVRTSRRLA